MPSAKVITITSGKGGVGKTTAVANLAVALASDGFKVVCIDGDIGLRNLDVILGLENRIVYDSVDVIEGRCRLKQGHRQSPGSRLCRDPVGRHAAGGAGIGPGGFRHRSAVPGCRAPQGGSVAEGRGDD